MKNVLVTFERLALYQIEVIGLFEDAALEAAAQPLQVAPVNVKQTTQHRGLRISKRTSSRISVT